MSNFKKIYSGSPSIKLDHRPFFSIVVPCYNPDENIGLLLESILKQNMSDDIEVILSDDCSKKSYNNIIEPYLDKLSIKRIKTNYSFGPGHTREKGVSIAEGEWICFADQDDIFIENTLKGIKEVIIQNKEQHFVISNFFMTDPNTNIPISEVKNSFNFCFGKFYNMDNLWKPFNIHFKKGLLTHEDIYISSQVICALNYIGTAPLYVDLFTYFWMNRENSLSKKLYIGKTYLNHFLHDYIESTGEVYLDYYLNHNIDDEFVLKSTIEIILRLYFYMQGLKFNSPNEFKLNNVELCRKFFVKFKKVFKISNKDILDYVSSDNALLYYRIKHSAELGVGTFIEEETFYQWINNLHEDIIIDTSIKDFLNEWINNSLREDISNEK